MHSVPVSFAGAFGYHTLYNTTPLFECLHEGTCKFYKEQTPTEEGELVQNCSTPPTGYVAEQDAKEQHKRQIEDLVIPIIILLLFFLP